MNIEKLFTYHPPVTEERKYLHQSINNLCLKLALLIEDHESSPRNIFSRLEFLRDFINGNIQDDLTLKWLIPELDRLELLVGIHVKKDDYALDNIVKRIQIVRMFANQGITIDELEK